MDLPSLSVYQRAAADTVVAFQVQSPVAVATDVAVIVGALAVAVLALFLVSFVLHARRVVDEVRAAVRQNFGPVSDRARGISDNLQVITSALRTDVARLGDSVKALTDRLHQASDRMEERIEEFNALMEVVQSEAEDIFLDTASSVRGVRAGVREGTRSIGRPRPAGQDGAPPDAVESEESGPATREEDDGEVAAEADPAAPTTPA